MTLRASLRLAGTTALVVLAALGCSRSTGPLDPWPLSTDPIVFEDAFTGLVEFQAFGNSKLDALSVDTFEQFTGRACLKITVPNPGGGYAGGAFVASESRNLSGYDALTFAAKASRAVTLDVVGLGNDNTGTSKFEARSTGVAITTIWKTYVIPVPSPARLVAERGLFFFAAAPQAGSGYTVWFDDVKFAKLGTISNPRPAMTPQTISWFVGSSLNVTGTKCTFSVNGADRVVDHSPAYFTYYTSDPAVATVSEGVIHVVGTGTATITGTLDATPVTGTVAVTGAPFGPGQAPIPAVPAGDVISLFSDTYSSVHVDKWSADWDVADVADLNIFGDNLKMYTNVSYAGIEFTSQPIDATSMTYFHMDVSVPTGTLFKVKLVDFGANGVFGGGDDTQHELSFDASSSPPLLNEVWVGLEIPLASFTSLASRAHLAQLIISGDTRTVFVDNIYFHQ